MQISRPLKKLLTFISAEADIFVKYNQYVALGLKPIRVPHWDLTNSWSYFLQANRGTTKQQVKIKQWKVGIPMNPGSRIKLLFHLKNISLTMCQSSEHLEDILLTKLLGQFIEYIMLSYLKD